MTLDELKPLVEAKLITQGWGWSTVGSLARDLEQPEDAIQAALEALNAENRAHQNGGVGYYGWTKPCPLLLPTTR